MLSNRKILLIALSLIVVSTSLHAQYFGARSTYWKNQRHTMSVGIGASNFLGELGGRDQIGSDFVYDLEFSKTRPSIMVNYKYQMGSRFFARTQFTFGYIAGNDALTNETFRQNRNLHFRSPIFELALMLEANILDFQSKSRYQVGARASGLEGWTLAAIAGIGVARFNPQGNLDGTWYNLQPLGTEGQGLEGGPEPYSLFTVVIPLGLRVGYEVNKEWSFGLEVIHRITFTDYMDDVSGVYYDNNALREQNGDLAAIFADPNLGNVAGQTNPGQQRGNLEKNDSFMTAHLVATYTFNQKRFKRSRGRVTKRKTRRVIF